MQCVLLLKLVTGSFQNLLRIKFFGRNFENSKRHIDTAYHYQNEAEVGRAINFCINSDLVKREDIFLTTKSGFEIVKIALELSATTSWR